MKRNHLKLFDQIIKGNTRQNFLAVLVKPTEINGWKWISRLFTW